MSQHSCTVTLEEVYGKDWVERNLDEVNRRFKWKLGLLNHGEIFLLTATPTVVPCRATKTYRLGEGKVRIVVLRERTAAEQLGEEFRKLYGESTTIPTGFEWTGEFRKMTFTDQAALPTCMAALFCHTTKRVIIRRAEPKTKQVITGYIAETEKRSVKVGEYFCTSDGRWVQRTDEHGYNEGIVGVPQISTVRVPPTERQVVTVADVMDSYYRKV